MKEVNERVKLPPVRSLSKACPSPEDIRQARVIAGDTIREMAQALYVPTATVSRWMDGTVKMHPALAELYYLKRIKDKDK